MRVPAPRLCGRVRTGFTVNMVETSVLGNVPLDCVGIAVGFGAVGDSPLFGGGESLWRFEILSSSPAAVESAAFEGVVVDMVGALVSQLGLLAACSVDNVLSPWLRLVAAPRRVKVRSLDEGSMTTSEGPIMEETLEKRGAAFRFALQLAGLPWRTEPLRSRFVSYETNQ